MASKVARAAASASHALATLVDEIGALRDSGDVDLYSAFQPVLERCASTRQMLEETFELGAPPESVTVDLLARRLRYAKKRRADVEATLAEDRAAAPLFRNWKR